MVSYHKNFVAAPTEYLTSPATVATTVGTYIIIIFINKYWKKIFTMDYCKTGIELVIFSRVDGKELFVSNKLFSSILEMCVGSGCGKC